jgi:hypothetical protein
MEHNKQSNIVITISRGGLARNLLQNDFFALIKQSFNKVIILSPAYNDERFIREFKGDNVEIIDLPQVKPTRISQLITRVNSFLIYNKNTVRLSLYDYITPPTKAEFVFKYIKYLILRLVFSTLSLTSWTRKIIRQIDAWFVQTKSARTYYTLLREKEARVAMSTNIIEDEDVAMLRAAQKAKIKSIAMPKSWDNISKRYFRVKADKIVVWSEFMKQQMIKLQDYKESEIDMVGVPQFDYYIDKSIIENRNDFCHRLGLDPKKKIILFGSEGKLIPSDADIASIIYDLIEENKLSHTSQLLIRPHFGYKDDEKKFVNLLHKPNVVVDSQFNHSKVFRDKWDYSTKEMHHFLNLLFHADVIISTCSTLVLDAAALNKCSILIKFDGCKKKPFYKSSARWYVCDYFDKISKCRASLEVESPGQLRLAINRILNNDNLPLKELSLLKKFFCNNVDGAAGKRLYESVRSRI